MRDDSICDRFCTGALLGYGLYRNRAIDIHKRYKRACDSGASENAINASNSACLHESVIFKPRVLGIFAERIPDMYTRNRAERMRNGQAPGVPRGGAAAHGSASRHLSTSTYISVCNRYASTGFFSASGHVSGTGAKKGICVICSALLYWICSSACGSVVERTRDPKRKCGATVTDRWVRIVRAININT